MTISPERRKIAREISDLSGEIIGLLDTHSDSAIVAIALACAVASFIDACAAAGVIPHEPDEHAARNKLLQLHIEAIERWLNRHPPG